MLPLRLIPFSIQPATYNMAADEFMLSCPGSCLRFYGWSRPTLSFGRMGSDLTEIDLDACAQYQIELVRRLTGGKTVLHHYELTYAISSDNSLFSDSILQTYRMISQPLSASLMQFGIPASIMPQPRTRSKTSICFREISTYEIAVHQKKLVGSAQYRRSKRFLQHGSILIDLDWTLWKKIWKLPPQSTLLEDRITTIQQETRRPFDREEFMTHFTRGLAEQLNTTAIEKDFTPEENAEITELSGNYAWKSEYQERKN